MSRLLFLEIFYHRSNAFIHGPILIYKFTQMLITAISGIRSHFSIAGPKEGAQFYLKKTLGHPSSIFIFRQILIELLTIVECENILYKFVS